jgi:hypothetical protein
MPEKVTGALIPVTLSDKLHSRLLMKQNYPIQQVHGLKM